MTRREFIQKVGLHGGSTLAAMGALGFLNRATGFGADLSNLASVREKNGRKVVILGAGIAGMCAAYELGKLGFECTILESSQRTGGRSLTIRRGDTLTDTLGHKQTCEFDEGHYFNAGPARFAQWQITMDYCRELGVAIEPFINVNEACYYLNENVPSPLAGKRLRQREAKADLRGYNAELLAKAVNQDKLDQPLTGDDKEKLIDYLRREGDLDPDSLAYKGSTRRGYKIWPAGGMQSGDMDPAYPFKDLVLANLIQHFHRANEYEYQPAMFQPVGGMDMLAKALAARVKDVIKLGAEVKEIRKQPKGARVVYADGNETKEIIADYCICTIPPTLLRTLPTDFSPLLKTAITVVPFQNSARIGVQFKRRFWEEDDRIFGGISWTNQPINEIYYPSHGFFAKKGVLIGYYMFGPASDQVTQMAPADRIEFALAQGEKIHPQYRAEFENAFSVNWST
ncbi:MAG TPA: flavin monoamine oxidase family protein, partial [Opitutaceae bacterium]|nr:flavin monoamine oxidase family protein [Opitutaceae bacterium]